MNSRSREESKKLKAISQKGIGFLLIAFTFLILSSFNISSRYYNQTASDFFASGLADKTLNVNSADPELLNATVFHAINLLREKKGRTAFEYSDELYKMSKEYMDKMEKKKFTDPEAIQKRYAKVMLNDAKTKGFKGTLVNMNAIEYEAIDYNGKEFFYNRKDSTTALHLFYGKPPVKNEKKPERDSIACYTYKTFAGALIEELVKSDKQKITTSKAYRFSACVLQWDYSTLYKKRIPKIKLIQVAGGFQTDLMEEDLDEK
jgi:hypothetical protein